MVPAKKKASALGELLRYWRRARKLSQLDLALAADVSSRHISFLETGRSRASRDMVLTLADVLGVSLRDRNALLLAGGFSPAYSENDINSDALQPVKRSIEFLLDRHNPYPAIVVDRHWNLLLQNRAATALMAHFIADATALTFPLNAMRLAFDNAAMRSFVIDWHPIASALIQRLHREVIHNPGDEILAKLLEDFLAADDIPDDWRTPHLAGDQPILIELRVRRGDIELGLFSAITTLGTPLDVTLQELRLETFFPADEASDKVLRRLVDG